MDNEQVNQGPSREELLARIAELEQAAAPKTSNGLKVGDKGGISLYDGNGRFPATFYAERWLNIAERNSQLLAFIDEHFDELSFKDGEAKRAAKARLAKLLGK